jgi:8-oxo-dGTP pyrophosphatase MutT (NUDIX family)
MTIDKVAWLYLKDKKILMVLKRGREKWYNAGGKREPGETDEQTLIREVKEELSVDIVPSTIKYYETFEAQAHGEPPGTMLHMKCHFADYTGTLTPQNEIISYQFMSWAQKSDTGPIDDPIFNDLKQKGLLE